MKQTMGQVCLFMAGTVSAFTTRDPASDDDDNDANDTSTWMSLYRREFLPAKEMADAITMVSYPIILVLGVFGNVMIILIMNRLPASLLSVFFQVLGWSDLVLLLAGVTPNILTKLFSVTQVEDLGSWPCRLLKVAIYTAGVVSPWVLVALTLQRAASVLWPHRVKAVWTRTKSRVTAGVLVSVCLLMHCHFLYGWAYDPEKCHYYLMKCCPLAVSESYGWFYHTVWPWVDLIEFSVLPFVLLLISNSLILWKLIASVRAARRLPMQQNSQKSRQKTVFPLTVTLLTISGSFFLLTTPAPVYFILRPLVLTAASFRKSPVQAGGYLIFYSSSQSMWYANSAINFYLYCLTGTRFRAEFVKLMREIFCCFFWTQKAGSERGSAKSSAAAAASSPDTEMRTVPDDEEF